MTILPTVSSSAYRFNFHLGGKVGERTVGHTLVLGQTGSGKTLGTAFLIAQARRTGARVIVFDKDRGLEMPVRGMGGAYSAVRLGEATGFNPFAAETDDRGRARLTEIFETNAVRTAWLSYVFRRIERTVEDSRPTLIALDEAWKLLDDPYFERRLKDWMLTMRKKNVAVVLLTQRVAHIRESKAGRIDPRVRR